ncbi:efflux RND transporter periplasmic adaptor subunit [Sphaerisporangium sp. NPDC004334]
MRSSNPPTVARVGGLALAGVVLAAAGLVYLGGGDAPTAARVELASARRGTIVSGASAAGSTVDAHIRDLAFGADGTVEKVYVSVGQKVRKGQVLARIDDTIAQEDHTAAKAALAAAEETRDKLEEAQNTPTGARDRAGPGTPPPTGRTPTGQPSGAPSGRPSQRPSGRPTGRPSGGPSVSPTGAPACPRTSAKPRPPGSAAPGTPSPSAVPSVGFTITPNAVRLAAATDVVPLAYAGGHGSAGGSGAGAAGGEGPVTGVDHADAGEPSREHDAAPHPEPTLTLTPSPTPTPTLTPTLTPTPTPTPRPSSTRSPRSPKPTTPRRSLSTPRPAASAARPSASDDRDGGAGGHKAAGRHGLKPAGTHLPSGVPTPRPTAAPTPDHTRSHTARPVPTVVPADPSPTGSAPGPQDSGTPAPRPTRTCGTPTGQDGRPDGNLQGHDGQNGRDGNGHGGRSGRSGQAGRTGRAGLGGQSGRGVQGGEIRQGGQAVTTVAEAEVNIAKAETTLRRTEEALAGVTIKAPAKGTILTVSGAAGAAATVGSPFITLGDLDELQVQAMFSQTDVVRLKVGQPATVSLATRPGVAYRGKVAHIDVTATATNRLVQYGVNIAFVRRPKGLLLGQSATVQVTLDQARDAVYVPAQAVRTRADGVATVLVRDGGRTVERAVELGVRGDQYVEVTSGLAAGDQVELPGTAGGFPADGFPGLPSPIPSPSRTP